MFEQSLPPLSEGRENLSRFSHKGNSLYFPRHDLGHIEKDRNGISLYNLGPATAFLLRAKKTLPVEDYMNLFHDNQAHGIGIAFFPAGEGTEVAGFLANGQSANLLKSFESQFDISFGLPSEGSNSYIEYDPSNAFANIGCTAMIAAARGVNEDEAGIWKLTQSVQNRGRVGYKGAILTHHNQSEITYPSRSTKSIPSDAMDLNYRWVEYYVPQHINNVNVVKVDINQFTNTVLRMNASEQEDFFLKTCGFFHDIELGISNLAKNGKNNLFLGSRTADSIIFYLTDSQQIAQLEPLIQQVQKKYGVNIKTVGKAVSDVTLHSLADYHGKSMWNGRIFHSTKPVSECEWRELEIEAVQKGFPQHKVFFGTSQQK